MSSADLSKLTAIVYANGRHKSVERLIQSATRLHPQLRVVVGDDSRQPQPIAGADPIKMPAGIGVSASRNALLARVRTPYFLLLEETMELHAGSHMEKLLEAVASGQCDIAAGEIFGCRRKFGLFTSRTLEPGHATIDATDDALKLTAGARPGVGGVLSCDVTHNYFVARTDKVRAMGGWDPQLQVDERLEFFVRARRAGIKVGVCPASIAWRWTDVPVATPARDFSSLAVAKMGVSRLVDAEGRTFSATAHSQAA